jgi:hypothetical protein
MAFTDGQRYAAEVIAADLITSSHTGTEGIELQLNTEEGQTTHVLWLTEKNRDNVWRSLEALGVKDASRFHPVHGMEQLIGAHCTLTMREEEYRGRTRVRVRWINQRHAAVTDSAVDRALRFFGHETDAATLVADGRSIVDDDIPF